MRFASPHTPASPSAFYIALSLYTASLVAASIFAMAVL